MMEVILIENLIQISSIKLVYGFGELKVYLLSTVNERHNTEWQFP